MSNRYNRAKIVKGERIISNLFEFYSEPHPILCKDSNKRAKYKACFDILLRVQDIFEL